MGETRLERMEEMLSKLITMVGSINSKQQLMLESQAGFERDLATMKSDQAAMRGEIAAVKSDQAAMRGELAAIKSGQTVMRGELAAIKSDQAAMRSEVAAMKNDQAAMRSEVAAMKNDQAAMRSEIDKHHSEIMGKLTIIQAVQDHIWEKTVRNERDISILKKQIQL